MTEQQINEDSIHALLTHDQTERDVVSIRFCRHDIATVVHALTQQPETTIDTIVDVKTNNEDGAWNKSISALAIASSPMVPVAAVALAGRALSKVCTCSADLLRYAGALQSLSEEPIMPEIKEALVNWYLKRPAKDFAYQVASFPKLGSVSHKGIMDVCNPWEDKTTTAIQHTIIEWVMGKLDFKDDPDSPHPENPVSVLWASDKAKLLDKDNDTHVLLELIKERGLPIQQVPDNMVHNPEVKLALLHEKIGRQECSKS